MDEEFMNEDVTSIDRPMKKFRIDVSKLNEETDVESELKSIVNSAATSGEVSLLGKSIQQLKLELHLEEQKKRKDAIETMQSDEFQIDTGFKQDAETQLWVEKFKPKDYFELLSDDGTNRLLLTWIKSWDYIVFGKEKSKENGLKIENKAKQQLENSGKKRKRNYNQIEAEMEEKILDLDEYNRPRIKVALISGPPGLGKTTLAHIIAKRAGYNIIEMNASDDRSVESFRQHIESVTQTRGTVNDVNMKPSCLVIDEIDGAPQNSVQVLIDHVQETVKSSKKDKQKLTVLRPIICICNDLYAPSLRQLRQVSIVFQCFQVSTHRLAERLYSICNMSNLHCDMDAMVALCDKTSNDIRSALNTLQFLSKRTNRITSKIVKELNIGQKDMEKSVFTIMNEIFFKKYETKKEAGKSDEPGSRFNTLVEMAQMCDLDRLLQGLYENFLFVRFRDSYFESVIKGEEWLLFCDRMTKQMRDSQDYSLLSYQKFIPPLFHMLFSSTNSQLNNQTKKLKYPNKQYEVYMSLTKNSRILTSFLNDMSASTRLYYNSALYSTVDLLPHLTQIIQPNIRPVAIQLLTKTEKEKFDNLIKIMIAFNLIYRQEKGSDGQFNFVLEPAIEEVIKFSGLKQHKQLCYIIKQQISREIMLAKVKSIDRGKVERVEAQKSDTNLSSSPRSPGLRSLNVKELNKSRAKDIEEKEKKSRENSKPARENFSGGIQNFFTKLTVSKDTTSKKSDVEVVNNTETSKKLTDGIYLKYKEGFTNAVRYNIKISELL